MVSQDAVQLMVKNTSNDSDLSTLFQKNIEENSSEDMRDAIEDESEINFEICSFTNENFNLGLRIRPSITCFQKNSPIRNIYLERFTPPPQV